MTVAVVVQDAGLNPLGAPVIPPAPVPPARPSTWRFLRSLRTDVLGTFATEAYQRPVIIGRLFGQGFLLVNDPAGTRVKGRFEQAAPFLLSRATLHLQHQPQLSSF